MPQRNFCDRCGDEIPVDISYFLIEIRETNIESYRGKSQTIHNGRHVPLESDLKMVCKKCATIIYDKMHRCE